MDDLMRDISGAVVTGYVEIHPFPKIDSDFIARHRIEAEFEVDYHAIHDGALLKGKTPDEHFKDVMMLAFGAAFDQALEQHKRDMDAMRKIGGPL